MSLVTVAEVKALGRIDYDTHDTEIQLLIDGAEGYVEDYCNIRLSSAAYTDERVDSDGGNTLWPDNLPITAVSAVKDAWNDNEVEDAENYFFTDTQIKQDERNTWEEGELRWKVSYTAGYTAATAPAGLKNAIIGLTLRAYNNPEGRASDKAKDVSRSWEALAGGDLNDVLDRFSLYRYVE